MRYPTRELGVVEVAKNKVICFTAPLLGFESFRKYVLLPAGRNAGPFYVLQSLDEPQLAFPVVRAEELFLTAASESADSHPGIVFETESGSFSCASSGPIRLFQPSAEDLRCVAAATPEEAACWIIAALPRAGGKLRLNLRAPVLVNEKKQLAAQIVLSDERAGRWKSDESEMARSSGEKPGLCEQLAPAGMGRM